jgi:hypothetical protein
MPRLTDRHYLKVHKQLKQYWCHLDIVYGYLTSTEQWQLHDYFQPSKDLSETELLQHRRGISNQRPNLPHQAGRALAKLQTRAAHHALQRVRLAGQPAGKKTSSKRHPGVRVLAVVKPEPDLERLARALWLSAMDQERKTGNDSRRPEAR